MAGRLVADSAGRQVEVQDRIERVIAAAWADVLAACAREPQHAAGLLSVLFKRPLDLHQTTFAIGEAIAHLHALWHDGKLQRARHGDGIYRFSCPAGTGAPGD